MTSTMLVVTALVLVILVAGGFLAWSLLRRRSLPVSQRSEYDRVIGESESRLAADRDLRDRQRRHATVEFKALSQQARFRYAERWQQLQIQFIAAPQDAVTEADDLVTQLVADLGYLARDYYEQPAQLAGLESYREAHQISLSNRRGEATNEQLRLAVAHFRALVAQLLGEEPLPAMTAVARDGTQS